MVDEEKETKQDQIKFPSVFTATQKLIKYYTLKAKNFINPLDLSPMQTLLNKQSHLYLHYRKKNEFVNFT